MSMSIYMYVYLYIYIHMYVCNASSQVLGGPAQPGPRAGRELWLPGHPDLGLLAALHGIEPGLDTSWRVYMDRYIHIYIYMYIYSLLYMYMYFF